MGRQRGGQKERERAVPAALAATTAAERSQSRSTHTHIRTLAHKKSFKWKFWINERNETKWTKLVSFVRCCAEPRWAQLWVVFTLLCLRSLPDPPPDASSSQPVFTVAALLLLMLLLLLLLFLFLCCCCAAFLRRSVENIFAPNKRG